MPRKRSRQAREQRAVARALRVESTVGVRGERSGRFYPNHDREQHALDASIPDEPPRDPYWTEVGEYVEVCDRCKYPGEHPHCRTCGGNYEIRRILGSSPATVTRPPGD